MKKNVQRFWMVTAICGGTALVFLLLTWGGPQHKEFQPLQKLEFDTQDARVTFGRKAPMDPRLVFIGIDRNEYSTAFSEADLKEDPGLNRLLAPFPWTRTVWADLVQKLADAGARVIVLDLLIGGERPGDDALRQVLNKYSDRVLIVCNFSDIHSQGDTTTLELPSETVLDGSKTNAFGYDSRMGYDNVYPDWDKVLRRAQYRMTGGENTLVLPKGVSLESIDAAAVRKLGEGSRIPNGTDPIRFRYSGIPGTYRAITLDEVMGPRTWKMNFKNGDYFRGKVVVIGPASDIFQDAHITPFPDKHVREQLYSSVMYGPEIHLNIINAALNGQFLHETRPYENTLIIFAAGLLATALSFLVHQPVRRLTAIVLLVILYWYAGQFLFDRANLVIPVASPLLVLTISGVFVLGYDYFVQQFERARVRKTLERYVSKNIVKDVLDNPESYLNTLGGVRRPVTVLFSDIRGFTTMTESADETKLVKQLNEYLAEMTRHVFALNGTLDKYIGDAIMAVWGNIDVATKGPQKDAEDAVATALDMRRSLPQLNASWKSRGIPELSFGIGINHGEAIVCNLGSDQKMDPTVIGDTVNTASRLEGLTKWFHVDLLVSESAARLVRERFVLRTLGLILPKGKTKPFDVFTVLGERGAQSDKKLDAWLAEWEEALKLYRARKFEEALQKFQHCRQQMPDDYLSERYCHECEALLKQPPDDKWNGVFVMSEK